MRFALLLVCSVIHAASPTDEIPMEVRQAIASFRPEGPRDWSFTQTTAAEGRTMVERYDGTKPEFNRWSLLTEDGKPPTDETAQRYRQKFYRHTQVNGGPRLNEQIDLTSIVLADESSDRSRYHALLKTTEAGDVTAAFLRAVVVWHKGAAAIESFTLESTAPFAPTFGVKIQEMRTTLTYSLPTHTSPGLLEKVTTRLRGRAFWFKSLDADMEVSYSNYVPPRSPAAPGHDQRP